MLDRFVSCLISLRTFLALALLTLFFVALYTWLPYERQDIRLQLPGALISTVGWIGCSYGFSIYFNYFGNYSYMYGSLTAVVILMLWLYACICILFFGADVDDILAKNPDMVLIDFLMPEKDGVQVMRELRERGCKAKCIMISQVAAKELIGKAYDAGIEFFISKPINIIEVKSVIRNVDEQIKNEKTLTNIKKMFMAEIADMPKEKKKDDGYGRKVLYILNRLGMSGEKGGDDILRICEYLHNNGRPISQVSIGQLCELLSDAPKNMEQRVRRAIAVGMSNLAHLGIEDFMNETFTASWKYSPSSLRSRRSCPSRAPAPRYNHPLPESPPG